MKKYQPRRVNIRAKSSTPVAPARRPKTLGQSLIEFALVAPLLLLIIFGIIDMARIIQAQVTINNAARQAIRFAITGQQLKDAGGHYIPRVDSIISVAKQGLAGLPLTSTDDPQAWGFYKIEPNPVVTQTGQVGNPDDFVEVHIHYTVKPLTPLVNAIIPFLTLQATERGINEEWGAVQTFDRANLGPLPPALPTWTPVPYRTQTFAAQQTSTSVARTQTAGPPATMTAAFAFTQTVVAGLTQTAIAIPTQTAAAQQTSTAAVQQTSTAQSQATDTAVAGVTLTAIATQTSGVATQTKAAKQTQTAIARTATAIVETQTAGPLATQTAQAGATQTSVAGTQTALAPTATNTSTFTPTFTPTKHAHPARPPARLRCLDLLPAIPLLSLPTRPPRRPPTRLPSRSLTPPPRRPP